MDDSGEARIPRHHVAELSRFYAAHDRWLFGHACVRTRGDRELAADLVQDAFEAAARAWATLRGRASGRQRAWLSAHAEAPSAADPVKEYLKQIGQVPGLSAEQEEELAKRIEAGRQAEKKLAEGGPNLSTGQRIDLEWVAEVGTRAKNHLLEANLRLVVSLAKRYTGRGHRLMFWLYRRLTGTSA